MNKPQPVWIIVTSVLGLYLGIQAMLSVPGMLSIFMNATAASSMSISTLVVCLSSLNAAALPFSSLLLLGKNNPLPYARTNFILFGVLLIYPTLSIADIFLVPSLRVVALLAIIPLGLPLLAMLAAAQAVKQARNPSAYNLPASKFVNRHFSAIVATYLLILVGLGASLFLVYSISPNP